MAIQVHIPTPMRPHADNRAFVDVEGGTVQGALTELGSRYPALFERVFENGQVRRFINIYVNDEDIRYLDNLQTGLKDGDSLSIIPAVAGG
jgi:molybdopterin synthase sulfur carrier subunit